MFLFISMLEASSEFPSDYVTVKLNGQLGNQLFQIATAYAYAMDHQLNLTVPDLVNKKDKDVPYNRPLA